MYPDDTDDDLIKAIEMLLNKKKNLLRDIDDLDTEMIGIKEEIRRRESLKNNCHK